MVAINPECYHLSASSIAAFKACPTRFRLAYREGIRSNVDNDSQRQGTNWHWMHEIYANELAASHVDGKPDGTPEEIKDYALDCVVTHLNERYAEVPSYKTALEWALERQILLTSFIGYQWYFQNDPVEFVSSEVPFSLPLIAPKVGLPLPTSEVLRVGKIDHVIKWQGGICAHERKSTSRSIAADSDYWDIAKKDTQVSMYALAFLDMRKAGMLGDTPFVIADPGTRFGNTLYDVWHKPTIKPCTLTQKETAEFLTSGDYCGQNFQIAVTLHPAPSEENKHLVSADGESLQVEMGKKGFAVRESVEMYGARLLQDIYERPDFYFVRREIARTDAEIRGFRKQLFAVYQSQKAAARSGCWVENERQCRATFSCPYIPICYGPGADAVCDGHTTPPGFKRIFVDLTINGQEPEEA